MTSFQTCRICLRTDDKLQTLDGTLKKFYEELCDFSNKNADLFCCFICKHLLRKSLNFKKKCQESNKIFQQWMVNKRKKTSLTELYKTIPPQYAKSIQHKEIYLTSDTNELTAQYTIKVEKYEPENDANENISPNDNDINDDIKDDNYDNGFCNNDVSDDDKCLLDYIKDKNKVKRIKSKKKRKDSKVKVEHVEKVADDTKPKIKQRRPLKDHKEYETVFNIQLFSTEAEVRQEFEQRKTSEYYLSAKHKCSVCYTVYKCEKLVDFHMKWHDPSAGDFPCDVCAMRFKSYVSMRKHKTDVHFGRFQCKKCPLITYHKMVMILHYRKHLGVSYACKVCKRTYNHSSTYMSHLRKSHPTEHVCVTCAQTFVSEKGLTVHRKKVHNASLMSDPAGAARCEPCGLTFATQQVYTVHVMNTDKHKDIADTLTACPECGLQLPDKLQVRAHRRQAHPQYNYSAMKRAQNGGFTSHTCPLCGASGNHNSWLYRHFQSVHPAESYERRVRSDKRKHLCDQCGKSFYNITQLTEHAYTHSGLKPFRCEKCPAAFSSKTHLKFHSERHAPPSRECTQCGKKFVSAANLSNHMRSHIGDRRYKCSLCAKGFLHCAALREHIRGVHLHIRRQRKTHNK